MTSLEFTEWIAFWTYESEMTAPPDPNEPPPPKSAAELRTKFHAMAAALNSRHEALQRAKAIADGTVGMSRDDAMRPRRGA